MFVRRLSIALAFSAAIGASFAEAGGRIYLPEAVAVADSATREAATPSLDSKGAAAAPAAGAKVDPKPVSPKDEGADADPSKAGSGAPYPHIYQAPLFGSLFAITANDSSVDESALRYYASLHNIARADAEIRRLKALHPNWTPPTNIYSTAGAGVDEQPFWDLLAADRFDELRAGIALRMKGDPGWKPSRDLTVKIERKEAIEKLVAFSDQKKWSDVLEVADSNPSVLHCAYMDADWRVADAFFNIAMPTRAFEIYHAIIATCADHGERVTTIRKAIARCTVEQAKSLIAMGAKSGDGATEFDAVKIDLTRARIGAVNAHKSRETIEPQALADFFAEADRTGDPNDIALAGWFEYDRGRYDVADKWFTRVAPATPPGKDADDVKFAEGHALSLMKEGKVEAALRVAWEWRAASLTMRQTYVGAMVSLLTRTDPAPVVSDAMLHDFVEFVRADQNFEGAQALAWRDQNRSEWEDAASWFRAALTWKGIDPAEGPAKGLDDPQIFKAVEGYSAALSSLGRVDEGLAIADAWRGADAALRKLFVMLATNAVNGADRVETISPARLAHFEEIVRADRSSEGASALGWLEYRSGAFAAAVDWFNQTIAWSPNGRGDPKTIQGLALAFKQDGRLADAEEIAWVWRKQSEEMRAIYVSSFVAQLSADDRRDLIPPSRLERFVGLVRSDRSAQGAQALGWYRLKQGNCSYAAPWFRAASAWTAVRDDDAKNAEGLALSLSAVGQFNQAEDLAFAWRDRSPELHALYSKVAVEELTREVPVPPINEARIERFATTVLADHSALGAQALGWRRYRQAGYGYGAQWFRLATQWSDDENRDPKTDEGFALTLRAVARLSEAEALARRWADRVPIMKKLYIDIVVEELSRDNPPEPMDEARLTDFASMIEPLKSPLGAQALGWYRLERGEFADSAKWFKNAVDWWPTRRGATSRLSAPAEDYKPVLAKLTLKHQDYRRTPRAFANTSALIGKTTELYVDTPEAQAKTMEGYALALRGVGRVEEAAEIAYEWRDRWPSLNQLFLDIAAVDIARTDGAPIGPDWMRRYVQVVGENHSAAGAEAMAWRQYAAKDFDSAAEWFRDAMDWAPAAEKAKPNPRLIEGYVLALRGAKKYDEALALAGRWRAASARLNVLYLETSLMNMRDSGGSETMSAAKLAEVETAMRDAHSPDGALYMGWLAFEDKDLSRALTWFQESIDWSGQNPPDPKALEGAALTLRTMERYAELATFARRWRDSSARVRSEYYTGMIAWLTRDPPAEIDPETRADFEALVREDRNPTGAQAIAWSHELRQDWAGAQSWFATAIAWGGFDPSAPGADLQADKSHAKLVEGYIMAMRGAGDLARAEEVAFAWRGGPAELRGLYTQIFTQELAKADSAQAISPERLARFAKIARDEKSAVAAQNLGWFSYRAKDATTAIGWFEQAMAWSPRGEGDAKTNEGYALSLRAAGRLIEAEDFAWIHRDQAKELRQAYVAAVSDQLFNPALAGAITPTRLERFATVVRADKFASGAQAMGWRRLQDGNCGYSLGWFRAALAWSADPKDGEKASSGLAQGLRAVGMFNEAEDVAYGFVDKSRELRELYLNIGVEELTRQWPRIRMTEARISRFGAVVLADRSSVGAQAIAWRRYGDAGCGYGGQWFQFAATWSSDGKGDAKLNEGWALTQRAVGRLTRAEALVLPWVEKQPYMKKLYIDVAVDELSRDNPPEPIPEARIAAFEATITPIRSALGAQALAWYRFARGENDQAAKWFRNALDWWPHPKSDLNQMLPAPPEEYHAILAKLALKIEDYRRTPRAYPNSSLLIGKDLQSYVDTSAGLAKTVEGYVLTLEALGRSDEAETLAFEWRDRWPRMRQILVDLAVAQLSGDGAASLAPERIERFATVIEAEHSARGAEALGWREFTAQRFDTASRWFKSALEWTQADGKAAPDLNLVQGYALALRGGKQYGEAMRLLNQWREKLPELQALYVEVGLDDVQSLDPASPDAAKRLADLAAAVSKAKSSTGATTLGWLAFQRKEYVPAQAWFKQAIVWTPAAGVPDVKALEGYARSLQAEQRVGDFLTFTSEWGERVASLKPLFAEAATQAFAAAAASGEDVPLDLLVRAGKIFAASHSAKGAQALAWQRIAAKDWVAAAAWFQAARTWSNGEPEDPKITEGLIIALRNQHRDDEAEALAFNGAAHDDNLRQIYLEIVADRLTRSPPAPPNAQGMRRYADFVMSAKSALGAQALGWYSYNAKQTTAAAAWFETSLSWEASESAALGLAFTYRRLGDRAAYARVISTYGPQFAKVADLANGGAPRLEERRAAAETDDPAPERVHRAAVERAPVASTEQEDSGRSADGGSIASALNAKNYSLCVARADAASREGALNVGQQNALGWCLLNLGRPLESARSFDISLTSAAGKQRQEAAYGKSLALLAGGETMQAGAAAGRANLAPEQRNAIGVQILEQRAWAASAAQRWAETLTWLDRRAAFAPETRDLMALRARCLDKLGRGDAANAIRAELDAQLGQ
jgi:hypothetical protein